MNILIKNAVCIDFNSVSTQKNVMVTDKKVSYVGDGEPENVVPDRVIDGSGCILTPGFVNAHCHAPMTLLRGLGSDCPLDVWLNDHIFPTEDKLTPELAYIGSLSAVAEMIRGGVTSFSDMYFFCDKIAEAVELSGIKANISRSIVSFDENENPTDNFRVAETISLINDYHNSADGRIKVDFSLHAEYTNTEKTCVYAADLAKEYNVGMQIHLSETKKEHEECKARRGGMTPAVFFEKCGVFDVPVTAAHCVWLEDSDMDIMASHNATAVHNPKSNLKLGSGVMQYDKLISHGVNVALGTDGSASNNKLDLISEMQLGSILHKGVNLDACASPAKNMIYSAITAGNISQGREHYTGICEGMTADLVLIDCTRNGTSILEDPLSTLMYAADRSDVVMTMVDGRILFESGEYNTIDIERLSYDYKIARTKLLG